jgi:hypothetical protein
MKDLKVWVRVGDQDDYHPFDSPELAAEYVHEYLHGPDQELDGTGQCRHQVERYQGPGLRGVELPDTPFTGYNGVSLFWGDEDAQLEGELSDMELFAFGNSLT